MSVSDPIADMLTRVRNACARKHKMVLIPFSKIKENIAKLLLEEGFITAYKITVQQETKFNLIEIELKYNATKDSVIRKIKRISRPGLRI